MTFVKYGNDEARQKLANESRLKCKSFLQRVEASKELSTNNPILKENGFASYKNDSINITEVVKYCRNIIDKSNLKNRKGKKNFVKDDFIESSKSTIDMPTINLALNMDIISIVAEYMGHIPILFNCSLWHSIHEGNLQSSQLFHCDWEDINSVNLFINISNISQEDGPLTLIPADVSAKIRKDLNYYSGPHDYRVGDSVINKYCPIENQFEVLGPPGTMTFVDTCKCFHYGSRVKENKYRETLVIRYLSPAAFNLNPNYIKTQPFSHLSKNGSLNKYQKLLLTI